MDLKNHINNLFLKIQQLLNCELMDVLIIEHFRFYEVMYQVHHMLYMFYFYRNRFLNTILLVQFCKVNLNLQNHIPNIH